ncbi:MAG: glucosyl transferase, partial [Ignavibacteriales bacterium]
MIKKISTPLIYFQLCLLFSCNSVEPPNGNNPTLALTLEDISCTETWITLTTTDIQLPAAITLKQNDQTRSTINLVKADTLLYIDSLLPNQPYNFLTVSQPINESEVNSNLINVTTMDTTSHNFTWQSWTFGEHSSSVLYDVVIINENNIWAVGEIYMNDSLGQPDPQRFNAIR